MNARSTFRLLRLLAALACMPALASAAQGDLMRITTTTHVDMPGAPPQLLKAMNRPFTRTRCIELARRTDPTIWPEVSNCAASNVHQSATEVSAHLTCEAMSADLDIDFQADGTVHGTVHMSGAMHGLPMTADQTIDAQRIGSCEPGVDTDDN
jgi:hypothetical protein